MMHTRTHTRPTPKISTPDYIGTGDSHNTTSSQSHRPIMPLLSRPNGNCTGTGIPAGRVAGVDLLAY